MNSHENVEICHVQNIYITLINLYYLGNVAVLSLLFKLLQNDNGRTNAKPKDVSYMYVKAKHHQFLYCSARKSSRRKISVRTKMN